MSSTAVRLFLWLTLLGGFCFGGGATVAAQPSAADASGSRPPLIAYQFILTRLPANTPTDASFYLAGSFNHWQAADARYRFRRRADGLLGLTLRTARPRLEYKVTRGSWATVEGSGHGQVRSNRVATRPAARAGAIELRVESWEDLSGTFQFYSLYDLLLLFSCFQAGLLLVAIPSLQRANRAANRWLLALLALGAAGTLLTVLSSDRTVANAYPQLTLLPDFLWFLYGPLFYGYVRRLLFHADRPLRPGLLWLPPALQLLVYLPYFLLDSYEFQIRLVSHDARLRAVLLLTGGAAWLLSGTYWLVSRRAIRAYTRQYQDRVSYAQNLRYLSTVLGLQALCLVLWGFLFALVLASRWVAFDVYTLAARSQALIWLVFSTLPYFLGYVVLHQPEIFRLDATPAPLPDSMAAHRPAAPAAPGSEVPAAGFQAVPAAPVSAVSAAAMRAAPVAAVSTAPAASSVPAAPAVSAAGVVPAPFVPVTLAPVPASGASAEAATGAPRPVRTTAAPELAAAQATVAAYMRQHKPYLNPSLTINELAAGLGLPPHVLSRVINEGFGQNFFDFVNSHRVEELKRLMAGPQARQYTLLARALEVGFNSKTAFNRAFKKHTGQPPREYFGDAREE